MSKLSATNYSKEWEQVAQLIEKGSMTTARVKAGDLFNAAREKHNSYYTLYGALMLQQIDNQYAEEPLTQALIRYRAIESELETADRALLMLFESKVYQRYLALNRWSIRQNVPLEKPTDDMATWDEQLFKDTIRALQAKALVHSDILKKTTSKGYADMLTEGDAGGWAQRPTLYDVIVQDILESDASDNDDEQAQALLDNPAIYGPAEAFGTLTLPEGDDIPLLRNLRLLQELTRFHASDDAAIRCALDEQRIQLIENSRLCDVILFREGLEQLAEAYRHRSETAERGHWYYRQACYWNQLTERDEEYTPRHNVTAYNLCNKGLAVAPKNSEAYASCQNLKARLTQPTLSINVPETLIPEEECPSIVSHSNLTHVWFRIIQKQTNEIYFDKEEIKEFLKQPVLSHWDMTVEDTHDYISHDTLATLPALYPGNYLLLASSTPDYDLKGNIVWVDLNVSALTLYTECDEMKGERVGIVVNRKTGQPVPDCDVSLWKDTWEKGKYLQHKVTDIDIADDGFFTLPPQDEYHLTLKATDGSSKTELSIRRCSPWEFSYATRCQLFTDRQSYRPGDEVQFSALVYEEEDVNHFHVVPEKEMKVELRDVNNQTVQTIEGITDAYGCLTGTFTLGENMLPGDIRLYAKTADEAARCTRYLNLEAYKQPTFAIRFESFPKDIALTDSVHVLGAAISYTAVPVQDARITYRITRAEQPSWRWWYGYGNEKTVARGTLTTNADGTFAIDIPPLYTQENKRLKDRCYRYHISVDITAIDGETQSQSTSVRIGKPYEPEIEEQRPDIMPENALLWGHQSDKTIELGDTLRLQWGTRQQDVCVVWFLERGYEVVDKGVWNLSDEQRQWTLPATEDWRGTQATLRMVTYHENKMEELAYTWEIPDHDRQLALTLVTFRDRLTPGQPETWTLHIAAHDGAPAQARLLSTLYDAALDVYGKNPWQLAPWHTFCMTNHLGTSPHNVHSTGFEPDTPYLNVEDPSYPSLKDFFNISYRQPRGLRRLMTKSAAPDEDGILYSMAITEEAEGTTNSYLAMAANSMPDEALELAEAPVGTREAQEDGSAENAAADVYIREDLRHTAFFMPCLHTDKEGNVDITFTVPDLLTEWHFQNLAFTKDLCAGALTQSAITRKELMVQPNVPRFLRQGDSMAFTAKVSNVSDKEMDVLVRLTLTDARTDEPLSTFNKEQAQTIHLAAGEVKTVSFPVTMPEEVFACTYRITAEGAEHSDGEQGIIPVLTNRTLVTESLALYANPGEKKAYTLESLASNVSPTLTHHKLALEYTSTPIWYAIQALPALDEPTDPSNLQLFHRYFANSLSAGLLKRYPRIEEVFRQWAEETPDAFLSKLEKNNDLKQIVLSETPWLLEARSETADRRRIANFFDAERTAAMLATLRQLLLDRQNTDGGWSWMPDYPSSTYITLALLRGFSELQQEGCIDLDEDTELATSIHRAIDYVDGEYYQEYLEWVKREKENSTFWKKQTFTPICTNYLFVRSGWKDIAFRDNAKTSHDYFYHALQRVSHIGDGLMAKALTALTFERNGDHALAANLLDQLRETALTSDEMGMYWRDNQAGWYWYNAPIETQALLIQAFYECDPSTSVLPLMQQWLLKQKQTTHWDTDVATAHAVYALLLGGGSAQLAADVPQATLTVGGKKLRPTNKEAGTGYFRHDWEPEEIHPALARITIDNTKNPSCSWGALYWQYFEDMDKVAHSEQGFTVTAQYYQYLDDGSLHIVDGPLQVGDKVKVRLRFTVDRDLEYVQVKALRPACFEPLSTRSGRQWNGGISYYLAVDDASTSLYIDYLRKGDYTIEMDYFVTTPGEFLSGTVTLQCLYAPEFRATFSQLNVSVNENEKN